MLIGVGPDLQWLTGYAAKRARAADDARRARARAARRWSCRVSSAPPRRSRRPSPRRHVDVVDVGRDRRPVRARRGAPRARATAGRRSSSARWVARGASLGGLLVSDRLWATFLLRLQSVVPDAAFGLASAVLSACARSRTPTRSSCCARPPMPPIAWSRPSPRAPGGPHGSRRRARGARAARRRGPRQRLVLDRRQRPQLCLAASRAGRARDPGGRADRARYRRPLGGYCSDITRTLWVTGDADVRPDRRVHARCTTCSSAPRPPATAAVKPGVACQDVDRAARAMHHRRGLRRAVHPPHRPRHRPRGPRGSVHRSRAMPSRSRWATPSASSRASTSTAATARASRTSACAPPTGPTCSTSVTRDLLVVRG